MKKKCLFFILFICILNTIQAQISIGGTPFSFGSHFREKNINTINPKTITLEAPNKQKLLEDDQKYNYSRFAAPIPVNFNMENSGTWTELFNGDRIWRLKLTSEGAWCLRPLFDRFELPKGGKMFIYNEEKNIILGAFTEISHSNYMLGTEIIEDNNLTIEYYEPKEIKNKAKISLFRVDYGYTRKPTQNNNRLKIGNGETDFLDSGSCNINVNCALGADWQDQKRGTVKINLTSINGSYHCTGSMINNTNLDRKAYLLSANHCLSGGAQAFVNTWVFIFNYEATDCTNPTNEPSKTQSISGATIRANRSTSDMLLLELSSPVPSSYNTYFSGWSREIVASTSSVGIHHPIGDIKKISKGNNPSVRVNTNNSLEVTATIDSGTHLQVFWSSGITEPGSSGSPIFDQNKRIIGQLHGGPSGCSAAPADLWDLYGRVYSSWAGDGTDATRLSNWLDPTNSGVFILDGMSSIAPTTAIESEEISKNIKIYPNPAKESVSIEADANIDFGKIIGLNLFSSEGKSIEKYTMNLENNEYKIKIKVSNFAKGVYFFLINTQKGKAVKKIVIE